MAYKPDQGRHVRLAAFWSLALLIFYGCTSFYTTLSSLSWVPESFKKGLGGQKVPLFSLELSPNLLLALLVFGGAMFALVRYLNRPKTADLLIETENELRKVTWPTMGEAVNSSVVVIVAVLFLMAFLAGADWWLGRVAGWVLLGG